MFFWFCLFVFCCCFCFWFFLLFFFFFAVVVIVFLLRVPETSSAYLRNGAPETILRAATRRHKSQSLQTDTGPTNSRYDPVAPGIWRDTREPILEPLHLGKKVIAREMPSASSLLQLLLLMVLGDFQCGLALAAALKCC